MEFIPQIHSYFAYITVLFAIVILFASLFYFFNKKPLDARFKKLSVFTLISFHVQFLIGLATYFTSSMIESYASLSISEIMKDETARLLKVEHPLMMISGVIFITIANAKIKRTDKLSFGILLLVLFAVLSVLSRIPYDLWLN
jgi:hypothetical protein